MNVVTLTNTIVVLVLNTLYTVYIELKFLQVVDRLYNKCKEFNLSFTVTISKVTIDFSIYSSVP